MVPPQQPTTMVSRRTLLQYSLGAAGLASVAAACSASTSGGGGGGGGGGDAITFMATQFNPVEERQKYEAVLKQYAPGVNFNPVDQAVFATTIKSQVAAGKVQVHMVGGLHGDLAPYADQLEDLTALAGELQDRGYAKDLLDLAKLGGQTKYIPWIQASYVVAVNKKAMQWLPAGADVNRLTYDQYLAWAKAAKQGNGGKAVFGLPAGPKGLHHRFYQGFLLPSFTGGQMTTFMSSDAVTAWTYMKELWQYMNPASTNYDFMQEPLARGEVLVAWDHVARLVGAVGTKPDEWMMVPAPSGPKGLGYLLVVGGLAIPKGAPLRDKTVDALKKLSTPEAQIATLRSNAFFPTVKADPPGDLPPAIALEAKAVVAQQSAESAILALPPVGLGAKDGEVGQLFKNCFQQICLNGADPKATLQAQGQQLNAILADLKVPCWAPDPVQPGQVCKAS